MQIYGPNELVTEVLQREFCIGCGACVELCPYFKSRKGKTAMVFPCTLSQGRCFAHCPKIEVDFEKISQQIWGKTYDGSALGYYKKAIATKAGIKVGKGDFQAGGSVSALLVFAIEESIIEAAVLTDRKGLDPLPRLAKTREDIVRCAGSKFMASDTLSALNTGVREGYRRLGVVGTPCQITAVAQMRMNPLDEKDFKDPVALAIGLFCNWSLDTRKLTALLEEKLSIDNIKGMDIPPPPADVLLLTTDDTKIEVPLSEVKPLIPNTCFLCLDMTAEFADISVGMFEGRAGWNTMIIRSQQGVDIVEKAIDQGYLISEEIPKDNLEQLAKASAAKKDRSMRMLIRRNKINLGDDGGCCIARVPEKVVQRILK
jgi:coenzyme F420 hydrogenase subunit beta